MFREFFWPPTLNHLETMSIDRSREYFRAHTGSYFYAHARSYQCTSAHSFKLNVCPALKKNKIHTPVNMDRTPFLNKIPNTN